MLYELFLHFDINIFQYITFRAGLSFFLALIFTLFLMPKFIRWAVSKNFEQPIYDLVEQHKGKSKTPTMGGVVFLVATVIASLLTIDFSNIFAVLGVLTLLIFSGIGVSDDLQKIMGKSNQAGLSAKGKIYFQIGASLVIAYTLYRYGFSTDLYLPFLKSPIIELGLMFLPFAVLIFISSSNAVNLTDGLDGLATVPSTFALITLSVFAYLSGHAILSDYLLIPNIHGVGEIVIVASALIGALTGFLWFNAHPAEVFMGDSGSLAIGGFIAYMALITKNEVLLILIGSIFVLEAITVIIQVASYKTRKKRFFLMAPIHHHFEMKNWHENKIIVRFWIISLLSNIVALISLKIR
jgi:phospho-N-acetylmuramoyl-pentapeptide-transferase